ncbi:Factor arrest protein 11 [Tulasnella sp. 424]|nr:Factor arrest protein 11 [Tulasnella sp. 424]KAG8982095.1 Factor arrest protein 11 [Tulasnella sp. 425]
MEFPKSLQGAAAIEEKDIPDSITLGQLKSMMQSNPKPRQSVYDYRYDDEDTVSNEIEEFYSYIEMPQVGENLRAWQGSYNGEWIKSTVAQRRSYVEVLLESLEHKDAEIRFANARRLLYVLQGTFAETTSPEHQLHWIIENCKVVRAANGVGTIIEALKVASGKHDLLSSLSEMDTRHLNISVQDKADFLEEVNTELSVYFGMLYLLIEVFRGDDDFGEELMTTEPPFPIYLFGLVSSLKEKSAKGYPVKKLLLLYWKTLLTCLGGIRELQRVKKLSRELSGLPQIRESSALLKSAPTEFAAFRAETSVKFPTFQPPPSTEIPADRLAAALAPIPHRPHYHQHNDDEAGMPQRFSSHNQPPQPPQPATPAPTPPQSPKPKKQQYQTDQSRPFLFPFSRARGQQRLVPFAVEEADKLYTKHMHVSLALYQMWRTREDCILDESGLQSLPSSVSANLGPGASALVDRKYSVAPLPSSSFTHLSPDPESTASNEDAETSLPDVVLLQDALREADEAIREAEKSNSRNEKRKAKERREDIVRLMRVETLYKAMLPHMQAWVIVLLKLLLATVTATGANPPSANPSGFPGTMHEPPPPPPPTPEEIDVYRHREITSKAVSAILMLALKWLKVSHVMKFHHLGQLLLDSNCLLLILKMFGLQEVATTVVARNDIPEQNFFRYCYNNFSRNAQYRPEDSMLNMPRRAGNMSNGQPNEDDVELITDYSWRNFFSSINFIKVMQKLSKGRSHRIWLLVQYKSSAILKRILKVSHPMLQLHVLKLIKSQVPFCGRKWRTSNMKVITSIYLNCRPDLRDEWLTGTEVEDVSDALTQEQSLRTLVKFYNSKRYGSNMPAGTIASMHRRASSHSVPQLEGLAPGPEIASLNRAGPSPRLDADVFPPLKSRAPDTSIFLPYTGEDLAFEDEYEDYLSDLGEESHGQLDLGFGQPGQNQEIRDRTSAWHKLASFPTDITDAISDSESVVSIGDLGDVRGGDGSASDDGSSSGDEGANSWEHMSPKTFKQMPKSPASGGRRRSSGGGLRPVIPFGLDDGSALEEDFDEGPEMGPMPKEKDLPFAAAEGGKGIDEVEYMYQE